jgi:putative peptidoglycan lipid II flippase
VSGGSDGGGDGDGDGWSAPAIFGRSTLAEPRMFTEADPMSSALYLDDEHDHEARWSNTNYFGPRRHRPGGTRAVQPSPRAADTAPATHADAAPAAARPAPDQDDSAPDQDDPAPDQDDTPSALQTTEETTNRGLLASSRTMAVASLVSRITGFLRTSMLVAAIGVHEVGNAYNLANNLPNMVYELLLGGVLSSVLIPLLVRAQEDDDDDGVAYTQRLLSIATAALGVMSLLAVACAPLIAAGFVSDPAQRGLTSLFATLLLPEILFYGIGAMLMAVLNIRHSYGPGAWSPVLNNVIMIVTIGLFWLVPGPTTLTPASMTTAQILVLGIGTTLGIAAQALVLLPALRRSGFVWQWRFRAHPNEVGRIKELGSLGGWVLGYVVASQVGVTVIGKVGVSNGGFSVFTQADLLFQMPYGILVVSLLTALMPRLSRSAARGETAAVVDDLSLGARLSAIALVPITAGLMSLGPVLGVVLFAYGETKIADGRLIGTSLAISAFGLLPFALVMLQLRVFYAMRDGRTPTLINIFMVATKVLLVLVTNSAVHDRAHAAEWLNLATSLSYVIGAVIGHVALSRRLGRLGFSRLTRVVGQIGVASALGGLAAYGVVLGCAGVFGQGRGGAFSGLVGGSVVGLVVMALAAWQFGMPEVQQLLRAVQSRRASAGPAE